MEYIELEMLRMKELRPEIPCWAKAEKMELSAPLSRLWRYGKKVAKTPRKVK